jgi:hypothetical protein
MRIAALQEGPKSTQHRLFCVNDTCAQIKDDFGGLLAPSALKFGFKALQVLLKCGLGPDWHHPPSDHFAHGSGSRNRLHYAAVDL